MKTTARFDARNVRDTLLARGGPGETGFVRYAYRPFDTRWPLLGSRHETPRRKTRRLQAARVRGKPVVGLSE